MNLKPFIPICRKNCPHYAPQGELSRYYVPHELHSIADFTRQTVYNVCKLSLVREYNNEYHSIEHPAFTIPEDCNYKLEHQLVFDEFNPRPYNVPWYAPWNTL